MFRNPIPITSKNLTPSDFIWRSGTLPAPDEELDEEPEEVKKMTDEKTIKIGKGFVEYKDSTKEVCLLNVDGVETRITEKMFEEIKKVMGWK